MKNSNILKVLLKNLKVLRVGVNTCLIQNFISISIFVLFLIFTSVVKNETHIIEKNF